MDGNYTFFFPLDKTDAFANIKTIACFCGQKAAVSVYLCDETNCEKAIKVPIEVD